MFTSNSFYIASTVSKLIASKNDYSVTSVFTIRYRAYKDIYKNFALTILNRHIVYAIFKGWLYFNKNKI